MNVGDNYGSITEKGYRRIFVFDPARGKKRLRMEQRTPPMRTDINITQLPSQLPSWGGLTGMNTKQTDPDFSSTIVRVTDGSNAKFSSMQTADGPEAGLWNKDDTLLLCKTTHGMSLLFQFDPVALTAKLLPYSYSGSVCFSRTDPSVLFHLLKSKISRLTFAKVSGAWNYVDSKPVADFAGTLSAGFKISWTSSFHVSDDDSTFVVGYSVGGQNTGTTICVYQMGHTTGGYRMMDTNTGFITGDWGAVGKINLKSPNFKVPFDIHAAMVTPNPHYALITPSPHGKEAPPMVWDVATLNLTDMLAGGHGAKGFLHGYFGGPGGGQFKEVSYADIQKTRLVVPQDGLPALHGQKYYGDQHAGFGKSDTADHSIFWVSSQSEITPFTSCWMNEVRGYDAQTGVVHRACHTFNSGKSLEFIVQNAIAVPSQTGNFVAFTSDAMGSLGSTTGRPQGKLGTDARGDVFVVDVRNL